MISGSNLGIDIPFISMLPLDKGRISWEIDG